MAIVDVFDQGVKNASGDYKKSLYNRTPYYLK